MPSANITAKWLHSVKPPVDKDREDWFDSKQSNFVVSVWKSGKKAYYWMGRANGKQRRLKIGQWPAMVLDRAREAAVELGLDLSKGKPVRAKEDPANKTVGEVWKWFFDNECGPSDSGEPKMRTWKNCEGNYRNYLSQWSNRTLKSITRPQVIERKNELLKLSKGAANAFLESLKAVFRVAITNDWISKTPLIGIPLEQYESRDRFLLPEEMWRFMQALEVLKPARKALILVGLFTGARRTNVCEMRWDQIDFEAKRWRIPQGSYKSKKTKLLPLTDEVIQILETRKAFSTSEWVFPGRTKDRPVQNIKRQWKKLLNAAKIENLEFHDLRRTLGSWQAEADVSLHTIGKTLGHDSLDSTSVYARLQLSTVRKAVETVVKSMIEAGSQEKTENL